MAAEDARNAAIGRAVGLSAEAARLWRVRWRDGAAAVAEAERTAEDLEEVMDEILADAPRSGTPATFTPEQVAKVIAVACEKPADCNRPVSHWTPRELAAEVILRGIVQTISARHVGRFLKSGGPQAAFEPVLVDASARGRGGLRG
jgi:transposase